MTGAGATPVRLGVPNDLDGQRADRVVAVLLDVSRAAARQAFDAGLVTQEGVPVGTSDKLKAGAPLAVVLVAASEDLEPLDVPLVVHLTVGSSLAKV